MGTDKRMDIDIGLHVDRIQREKERKREGGGGGGTEEEKARGGKDN